LPKRLANNPSRPVPPQPSPDYIVRDQQRMSRAVNYFAWLHSLVEPYLGRRVLEIGCGLGNFTRRIADRELVLGIDSESTCLDLRRARFAGRPNILTFQQDLLAPGFEELVAPHRPDSIVCLNVLEHIVDDAEALRRMRTVLPSGGAAVLIVPAFDALYGPIDRALAHYRRYSKPGFSELARSAGFDIAALRYVNFCGFFGWWANARIFKRTEQSATQIAIFDTLIAPVFSRLERTAEPPLGQSLLAVLRKTRQIHTG
jgi:SAM-dependent methyltransferase